MPYRRIERGIKEAAVMIHERGLLPLEDILDVLVSLGAPFTVFGGSIAKPAVSLWQ